MSDSSTQINSKSIDKSSKKSYINWKQPNCGGISIHGEETCFVTIKDSDKSECKCVNPPDFDCTLYFKLGFSAQKHKPYLKSGLTWIKWGEKVCSEYPDQFSGTNSETLKKQFRYALKYTANSLNLTAATAGVETHPTITPFFKLFRSIYKEIETENLQGQVGLMLDKAKQDSILTFESKILPSPSTRSITGMLSATLSSKRSLTPVSQSKDLSPNSENEIDSKADINEREEGDTDFIFDELENNDKLVSAEDAAEATKEAVSKATNSALKAKLAKGIDEVRSFYVVYIIMMFRIFY